MTSRIWIARKRRRAGWLPFLATGFVFFPIALGLFIWWFQSHGNAKQLGGYLLTTFIYYYTFALILGQTMRRSAPRIFRLAWPWNWAVLYSIAIALTVVCAAIVGLLLGAAKLADPKLYWAEFGNAVLFDSAIAVVIVTLIAQYHRMRKTIEDQELDLRSQQTEKERALKLASEARLASLESRLHPHFLFNTLNSISALTQEDPAKAEQTIQRLSSLLRFSLEAGGRGLIPLREEMKIVRDYLDIEKTRFAGRLASSVDFPEALESHETPPLALQTLVENSVKYAIAPRREGGEVRVRAGTAGRQLVLEVWDNGPGFEMELAPDGHGLDNLRSRLASLFGADAGIRVERRNGGTSVMVLLPQLLNGNSSKP